MVPFLGLFFWIWVLGAALLLFPSAFCVRFCLCFLFFSGFLGFLFGSGCWAPRCSFFRRASCVRFCSCFLLFSGFFGFLFGYGCWAPCCFFFRRAFCVRFCLCFLFLSGFSGFLATTVGEGQRLITADWGLMTAAGEAYDSGRGADYRGGRGL